MSNMGYCRFQNTLPDLQDCYDNWDKAESKEEIKYRKWLLELAKLIVEDYGDDE